MIPWSDNHALFEQELKKGHKYQEYVAQQLSNAGLDIVCSDIKPVEYTRNKSYNYPEDKDIVVGGDFVIEVKSRSLIFTEPDNFPFDTAIVDTVRGWDQKDPEPKAVVIISQWTWKAVCINVESSKHLWTTEHIHDSVRGIVDNTYLCPKECLKTSKDLANWLRKTYGN